MRHNPSSSLHNGHYANEEVRFLVCSRLALPTTASRGTSRAAPVFTFGGEEAQRVADVSRLSTRVWLPIISGPEPEVGPGIFYP